MTRTKSKQRSSSYTKRESGRIGRAGGSMSVSRPSRQPFDICDRESVSFCFSYNFRKTVVNFNDYGIPTQ